MSLDPSYNRTRYSPKAPLAFPLSHAHDIKVPFDLNYDLDLWGRVRRSFESATRDADARVAAFESLRLTLHAEVAAVERRRSELKNAIALLVGRPASDFSMAEKPLPWDSAPPVVPPGLPGELLERRPDIAEAERDLASRNARIGVAKAAFFPTVRLTGFAGWESTDVESLFNWQSRIWRLGPSVTLPIFQGSRNRATLRRAQATWVEGVANYRERVLIAFKEVQDALTASRLLGEQAVAQSRALAAAQRSAKLSRTQYNAGFVSYLEVIESERTALATERASAQLAGQRFVTSIQLIKAIGGGWVVPSESAKR